MNLRFRQPRVEDKKHLDFIRSLPCIICSDNTTVEAAHVRFGWRPVAKRDVGKAEKPDDKWTLPLCGKHHREQHEGSEQAFWYQWNIDPILMCLALIDATGDHEKAEEIVRNAND